MMPRLNVASRVIGSCEIYGLYAWSASFVILAATIAHVNRSCTTLLKTVEFWVYSDNAFDREPSGIFPIAYNQTPVRPLPVALLFNNEQRILQPPLAIVFRWWRIKQSLLSEIPDEDLLSTVNDGTPSEPVSDRVTLSRR
jgi:hypothetical protein